MMKVAYYPGCSLHGLAKEYGISVEVVCKHLGINLKEIEDWNCCGATAAHSLNHELTISLSARNLAIARDMKMDKVLAPCAGCFSRLKGASYELRNNKTLAAEVAEKISIGNIARWALYNCWNISQIRVRKIGVEGRKLKVESR
jgi:heterodisulfide reductase subunit B